MELILKDISFYYRRGNVKGEEVLKGITLEFQEERCYLLTGPCGSGKTTLALLLKGLLVPTSGRISLKSEAPLCMPLGIKAESSEAIAIPPRGKPRGFLAKEGDKISLSSFQSSIGFVFQIPEEQFFKETVEEEVAFGPLMLGLKRIEERVKDGLNSVGLPYKKFRKLSPFNLSSGEQRRLAIASIIACEPFCYIFDEPTAGLDFDGRSKIIELIRKLINKKKTVIIISQELELFLDLCDELIVLEKGRIRLKTEKKTFLEKENLHEMELSLPYHIRILRILRKRGWNIPVSITDPVKAAKIIDDYIG